MLTPKLNTHSHTNTQAQMDSLSAFRDVGLLFTVGMLYGRVPRAYRLLGCFPVIFEHLGCRE